jgi:hypothetical protein
VSKLGDRRWFLDDRSRFVQLMKRRKVSKMVNGKPFRGEIRDWRIDSTTWPGVSVVRGWIVPQDDDDRGNQGFFPGRSTTIRTSPIVSKEKQDDGNYVVETKNSVYKLIGDEVRPNGE